MGSASTLSSAVRISLFVAPLALATSTPVAAQVPDAFAGHFGATRVRELGVDWSAGAGIMLLTQFGSRWKDLPAPPGTLTDYDQLDTTVGYNYLTGGMQWSWLLGAFTLALDGAGTLGFTSDALTEPAQDGLHNYRRFPHVQRLHTDSGTLMAGAEGEVSLWYTWFLPWFTVDFTVMGALASGTHHGEEAFGGGVGIAWWKLRAQGSYRKGFGVDQSVDPTRVGSRLESSYEMWQGLLTLDRTRYGAMADLFPSIGAGVTYSSGIFQNEEELFLSIFLEFPAMISNHSWRVEHVNDLLKDKDRGPTGGLRVVYVAR